jgi:hypothetical protein
VCHIPPLSDEIIIPQHDTLLPCEDSGVNYRKPNLNGGGFFKFRAAGVTVRQGGGGYFLGLEFINQL